ncbi:protein DETOXIFICATION 41 [Lathyrus oleraceus]|uniref:protein DETOXIFICATION 41 n=1 Tax=Pisum sativum TaxID=3888 RepID=UPI0021D1CDA1|nr:protein DETOXIFICATION 41-like [Pisum sativum]
MTIVLTTPREITIIGIRASGTEVKAMKGVVGTEMNKLTHSTSDAEVIDEVSALTPLLCISVLLNGIQPILSGVAIGSGWQALVAYVNLACYYVIGLTVGCVLGFKTSLGVAGIWWGMILGVFIQTVTLIILTARTDWTAEVIKT